MHHVTFAQGSQNQLKEVWEDADGLDPEDFDPKTFFKLHGKNPMSGKSSNFNTAPTARFNTTYSDILYVIM